MLIKSISRMNRPAQNSIFAALVVIAIAGIYKWTFAPQIDSLFAAQRYDRAMEGMVNRNEAVGLEIAVEEKKLRMASEELTRCREKLFTPEQAKQFFGDLQKIFEKTGCTVHSLEIVSNKARDRNRKAEAPSDIAGSSAILSVSGQYNSIIGLVEGLQNHMPMVWVNSFRMELADFRTGTLRCDMTVTIYTIQDKEAVL